MKKFIISIGIILLATVELEYSLATVESEYSLAPGEETGIIQTEVAYKGFWGNTWDVVSEATTGAVDVTLEGLEAGWETGSELFEAGWETGGEVFEAGWEIGGEAFETGWEVGGELADFDLEGAGDALWEGAEDTVDEVAEGYEEVSGEVVEGYEEVSGEMVEGLEEVKESSVDMMEDVKDEVKDLFGGDKDESVGTSLVIDNREQGSSGAYGNGGAGANRIINTTTPTDPTIGITSSLTKVDDVAKNIWATAQVIFQIAGFSLILIAGLQYMFASADRRGELKRKLALLAMGGVLVFASPSVINFVVNVVKSIIK